MMRSGLVSITAIYVLVPLVNRQLNIRHLLINEISCLDTNEYLNGVSHSPT